MTRVQADPKQVAALKTAVQTLYDHDAPVARAAATLHRLILARLDDLEPDPTNADRLELERARDAIAPIAARFVPLTEQAAQEEVDELLRDDYTRASIAAGLGLHPLTGVDAISKRRLRRKRQAR